MKSTYSNLSLLFQNLKAVVIEKTTAPVSSSPLISTSYSADGATDGMGYGSDDDQTYPGTAVGLEVSNCSSYTGALKSQHLNSSLEIVIG